MNEITLENFHESSFACFRKIESEPEREPDFVSLSNSKYWFEGTKVIRYSNHWSGCKAYPGNCRKIKSCKWFLVGFPVVKYGRKTYLIPDFYAGECDISEFRHCPSTESSDELIEFPDLNKAPRTAGFEIAAYKAGVWGYELVKQQIEFLCGQETEKWLEKLEKAKSKTTIFK